MIKVSNTRYVLLLFLIVAGVLFASCHDGSTAYEGMSATGVASCM